MFLADKEQPVASQVMAEANLKLPLTIVSWRGFLLGILTILIILLVFHFLSLQGLLGHYERAEYLKIADFDIKVLEAKRAMDSLKIEGLDEDTVYKYAVLITRSAAMFDLDPLDVVSVIWQESRFNPRAVSPTGDYGLMGINWYYVGRHHVKEKTDLFDVETNIRIGVEMLNFWRELSRKNTRKRESIPSFFNHYNQGVVIRNGDYGKKVFSVRKKLALHQMLVPNHLLAMENGERAIIGP